MKPVITAQAFERLQLNPFRLIMWVKKAMYLAKFAQSDIDRFAHRARQDNVLKYATSQTPPEVVERVRSAVMETCDITDSRIKEPACS